MKTKRNPARGFAGDLALAWRWLPWLILAYIFLQGASCTAPAPDAVEYRQWSREGLDSLWLECVKQDPVYNKDWIW